MVLVSVLVLPSRIWCWYDFGVAHWCFSMCCLQQGWCCSEELRAVGPDQ
jgi:hypothetical protein